MIVPEPFYAWHQHFAIDLHGSRAVFTSRRGGFSTGPYESLNLGRLTDDAPDAVERNRARLGEQVGRRLVFARQVHGSRIASAGCETEGDAQALGEADGILTTGEDVAPMVVTADCLPIAVVAERAAVMLHAGWRGLAAGIVDRGVRALRELEPESPLVAAIGPGAGSCCYEVDEQVHAQFAAVGPAARRGRNLDLKAIAGQQLHRAGVAAVHDICLCTICAAPSLFFSHRRDRGVTGRQAGLICLS